MTEEDVKKNLFETAGARSFDAIEWIIFSYGSLMGGYETVALKRIAGGAKTRIIVEGCGKESDKEFRYEIMESEWNQVLGTLFGQLHIRDWKRRYTENMPAADGKQWSLELWLTDGSIVDYRGINTFPAFWNELKNVFERFVRKDTE